MLCHNESGKSDFVRIALLRFVHTNKFKSVEEKMSQCADFLFQKEGKLKTTFCTNVCPFKPNCTFNFVDAIMQTKER
jgi:hypothetical protein